MLAQPSVFFTIEKKSQQGVGVDDDRPVDRVFGIDEHRPRWLGRDITRKIMVGLVPVEIGIGKVLIEIDTMYEQRVGIGDKMRIVGKR